MLAWVPHIDSSLILDSLKSLLLLVTLLIIRMLIMRSISRNSLRFM